MYIFVTSYNAQLSAFPQQREQFNIHIVAFTLKYHISVATDIHKKKKK